MTKGPTAGWPGSVSLRVFEATADQVGLLPPDVKVFGALSLRSISGKLSASNQSESVNHVHEDGAAAAMKARTEAARVNQAIRRLTAIASSSNYGLTPRILATSDCVPYFFSHQAFSVFKNCVVRSLIARFTSGRFVKSGLTQ